MKYKSIINNGKKTTKQEAEIKFPWLKVAEFGDATIDISNKYLIWKAGVWEGGVWVNGIWEDGTWVNGIWRDGIWRDGTWVNGIWRGGAMWSNLKQKFVKVKYENKEFKEIYNEN